MATINTTRAKSKTQELLEQADEGERRGGGHEGEDGRRTQNKTNKKSNTKRENKAKTKKQTTKKREMQQ